MDLYKPNEPVTKAEFLQLFSGVTTALAQYKAQIDRLDNDLNLVHAKVKELIGSVDSAFEAISEQTVRIDNMWTDVEKLRDELTG